MQQKSRRRCKSPRRASRCTAGVTGQFLAGNEIGRTANLAGRPKSDPELREIRKLARSLAVAAAPAIVEALVEVALRGPLNSVARVTASRVLLEYALGTPTPRDFAEDAEPIEFRWSMSDDDVVDAEVEEIDTFGMPA